MDGVRVNKITVNIDDYGETVITLYRTNTCLGTLSGRDLDIPSHDESGVQLKTYQAYCRDFVIELLNVGGIAGYYYEPKTTEGTGSIRYESASFKKGIIEYIKSLLENKYEYDILPTERIDVTERYKNRYIKNVVGEFDVRLTQYNTKIIVIGEIKSGQLCKPKIFKYNDTEYAFNITNIKRILKS